MQQVLLPVEVTGPCFHRDLPGSGCGRKQPQPVPAYSNHNIAGAFPANDLNPLNGHRISHTAGT
jgi:hypothetical protein